MDEYQEIVVISDTHFGAAKDETAYEGTNITGLNKLLDEIEKIKPKRIILLGDILDLWRVEFHEAWDEAKNFFEKLSNYVKESNEQDANKKDPVEVIYVIGNHDHYLKELQYHLGSLERYKHYVIMGYRKKEGDESKTDIDLGVIKKIHYPHYREYISGIGNVVFEHGHYSDGTATGTRKAFAWIYNHLLLHLLNFLIRLGVWHKSDYKSISSGYDKGWSNVQRYMESNLSAGYSAIYFSKMDPLVRAVRDIFYKISSLIGEFVDKYKRYLSALLFVVFGILVFEIFWRKEIALGKGGAGIAGYVIIAFRLLNKTPSIIPRILRFLAANVVSENKGKGVSDMMKKITEDDITVDRKHYTYRKLLSDKFRELLKNEKDKTVSCYVFGHTHVAGKAGDEGFKIYNTGSWVMKKWDGKLQKPAHCFSTFIRINPKEPDVDKKIKIMRMDNGIMEECIFDKKGNCKKECMKK